MASTKSDKNILKIELNTEEMSPAQIRMIKSINSMLAHVITTEEEEEYFDGSSELLRMVASVIKKANFSNQDGKIEYSKQALEFCADVLSDQIYEDDLMKYDN